jgi:hypothetical protein
MTFVTQVRPVWLAALLWLLLASATVVWTYAGFYDAVAIFAMCAGIRALVRDRRAPAFFWSALGIGLHYRMLWYSPIVAAAAWSWLSPNLPPWPGTIRTRLGWLAALPASVAHTIPIRWRESGRRDRVLIVGGLVSLALAGCAFLVLYPSLAWVEQTNPVHWSRWPRAEVRWFLGLWGVAMALAVALRPGRWTLLLATTGAVGACQLLTRQAMGWHALSYVPLVVLCAMLPTTPSRRWVLLASSMALYVFSCRFQYLGDPLTRGPWVTACHEFARGAEGSLGHGRP